MTFSGSETKTLTTTWNTKTKYEMEVDFKWKAGIPFIASEETDLKLKFGQDLDHGASETTTQTLNFSSQHSIKSPADAVCK